MIDTCGNPRHAKIAFTENPEDLSVDCPLCKALDLIEQLQTENFEKNETEKENKLNTLNEVSDIIKKALDLAHEKIDAL